MLKENGELIYKSYRAQLSYDFPDNKTYDLGIMLLLNGIIEPAKRGKATSWQIEHLTKKYNALLASYNYSKIKIAIEKDTNTPYEAKAIGVAGPNSIMTPYYCFVIRASKIGLSKKRINKDSSLTLTKGVPLNTIIQHKDKYKFFALRNNQFLGANKFAPAGQYSSLLAIEDKYNISLTNLYNILKNDYINNRYSELRFLNNQNKFEVIHILSADKNDIVFVALSPETPEINLDERIALDISLHNMLDELVEIPGNTGLL